MSEQLQVLRDWTPIACSKEMIKESRGMYDGKIMLSGIIQRANTLNQNGIRLRQPPIRKILSDMITEYKQQIDAQKNL